MRWGLDLRGQASATYKRQASTGSERASSVRLDWELDKITENVIEQLRALDDEDVEARGERRDAPAGAGESYWQRQNVHKRTYHLAKSYSASGEAGQPHRHSEKEIGV